MILLEILEKVYGRTKSGKLSHHAVKFCEKYKLNIDGENSFDDMMVAFSMLSNKDKREIAIRLLLNSNRNERKEERNTDLLGLRKMTYKESCKYYHPDNKETGDNGVFQFIQEFKMYFWDCDGNPKDRVRYYNWSDQKQDRENAKKGRLF